MTSLVSRSAIAVVMLAVVGASPVHAQLPAHQIGFFPVPGTRLYYEVAGTGPVVVLLHGGWLNSRQWDEQFAELSRTYRVIRYDVRGAGRSPLGDSTFAHYEDLAALLDGLNVREAHLVGLSAGGQLAIDFVLAYPDRVRSVVVGASPLRGYDLGPEFTAGMRGVIAAGVADSLQLIHDRMWAFAPFRVASTMPRVRERLNAMIVHQNTWATSRPGAPRPRLAERPPAERLGEIKVPMLVIVGDGEMPALKTEAAFVARSVPDARLEVVKNAGHFVNLEQPSRYTAVIRRWLRQHAEDR